MDTLTDSFDERLQEIDAYLDLLDVLQQQIADEGSPKIGDRIITTQQQKILYSSVYLQLYNLVEATANWCVNAVAEATADSSRWKPHNLEARVRREWIRTTTRTHTDLNYDHRLSQTVDFCDTLLSSTPISDWSVEKGGGGNWDDRSIEGIAKRLGCILAISDAVNSQAKRHVRDDKNSLALVKELRNKLAHGEISFEQCGNGVTVTELKEIKERTAAYLREVVTSFKAYIDDHLFLTPEFRP